LIKALQKNQKAGINIENKFLDALFGASEK
jgi:hypothetical protein